MAKYCWDRVELSPCDTSVKNEVGCRDDAVPEESCDVYIRTYNQDKMASVQTEIAAMDLDLAF